MRIETRDEIGLVLAAHFHHFANGDAYGRVVQWFLWYFRVWGDLIENG